MKDGNGRELRRLHDTVNQHLRALKATEHEPDGPFITSMLELKLDQNTMFEWHKFSQASEDVPHCAQMLEFLNLRAQASESSVPGPIRKRLPEDAPGKRGSSPRSMTSYVASVSDSCVACKTGKHPLYACQRYKSLPHDQMTAIVKSSGLCFNCLKPGHMVNRCPSNQRCRKCQRLHHSLLHLETGSGDGGQARPPSASSLTNPTTVLSHVARADSSHRHVLLMTSHVLVVAPDGSTTRARALLDSASSTSFISEHLAQHMRLHRRREFAQIAGIGGVSQPSLSQSVVRLSVIHPTCAEQVIDVDAVVKASSTTTKVRAVFDASAKSASGVSLNDQLLVGPTVHAALVDVLLQFRLHRIALATDVSRMYRAILLPDSERDLHRFVWRRNPTDPLKDFRMTRLTFGVSASSFAANMAVKQNAIDFAEEFPLAASVVHASFYVDDGLVGADSAEEATRLQQQLQELFSRGGFLLRKWKSSAPDVLRELPPHLLDESPSQALPDPDGFSKALGVEWSTDLDCFRLTVAHLSPKEVLSKRALISDVARTYDVLGWYAPAIITLKILFQRLWEDKLKWDDPVPLEVQEQWERWRKELSALVSRLIPRCYFPKRVNVTSTQLHGFSDASEAAYAGVVYLRMVDSEGGIHVSLVMAKTKVAPIKRLTVPRLELCGAKLLAELICHVKGVLNIPSSLVFAWTDSTVVLGWLCGKPRRFKTFVGNRVSAIMDLVPPNRWRHVSGKQNPADCASRGLFPCELLEFRLWWDGPDWLHEPESSWPLSPIALPLDELPESEETRQEVSHVITLSALPLLDRFSSFTRLKRVTRMGSPLRRQLSRSQSWQGSHPRSFVFH